VSLFNNNAPDAHYARVTAASIKDVGIVKAAEISTFALPCCASQLRCNATLIARPLRWYSRMRSRMSCNSVITVAGLILGGILCSSCFAQGPLPAEPKATAELPTVVRVPPQDECGTHHFWNKKNRALFAASAALSAADFGVTRANFQNGGRELNPMVQMFGRSAAGLALNFRGTGRRHDCRQLRAVKEKYLVEIVVLLMVRDVVTEFVAVTDRVLLVPAATVPKSRLGTPRERLPVCC